MVLDGMDVYEIKKALGHSDIKTTERYIGNITKRAPAKGVDNEKILEEYGSRHVDRHVKSENEKAQIVDFTTIQASQKRGASRI